MTETGITFAPLFNVRTNHADVSLALSSVESLLLTNQELGMDDIPSEVQQRIGFDYWETLWGDTLTWLLVPRASASRDGIWALHSCFELERVVTAIRLVKDTMFWTPIAWTTVEREIDAGAVVSSFPDAWMGLATSGFLHKKYDDFTCELGRKDLDKLQGCMDALASLDLSGPLPRALERYNSARGRTLSEDGIIDLFKSLEGVFQTDTRGKNIGQHLHERCRFVLEGSGETEPSDIARHYWVRNQISHATGRSAEFNKVFQELARDVRRVLYILVMRPNILHLLSEN